MVDTPPHNSPDTDPVEVPLEGGRTTTGVVRVGDTVRRPVGEHSPFVHRLLGHLEAEGFDAAPRFLGLDERGRETLTFLPGWVPPDLEGRRWQDEQLVAAAQLMRAFHDCMAGSELAGSAEVVCHNDLSPCNYVFRDARPTQIIDFDYASPGPRVQDLAYAAWLWLLGEEVDDRLGEHLRQLGVLLDAYGLEDRAGFAEAMLRRLDMALADHVRAGRERPAEWVRGEIAWVARHRHRINGAIT